MTRTNRSSSPPQFFYSGTHYISIAAYFREPLASPLDVVSIASNSLSQITRPLHGGFIVVGGDTSFQQERVLNESLPIDGAKAVLGPHCAPIRTAMFERASIIKALTGEKRNRPRVVVMYSSGKPIHEAALFNDIHAIYINIRVDLLTKTDPSTLTTWFGSLWDLLDGAGECTQGLVQYTCPDAGFSTSEYDQGGEGFCAWERRLAHARFVWENDRLAKLRGVFWGTFVGKTIARKLDPTGTLVERFNALPFSGCVSKPVGKATSRGGLWLQLNNDPLGGEPGTVLSNEVGIETALWLEKELRNKDLIW